MVDKDLFLHDLAVVAILKCEAPYLKEWLDYHLLAGVDHFYLYDNESPDNQAEIAKPYVEAGLVDYIPAPGKNMQMLTWNKSVKEFKFQCRYMAFIDGDEFIYPKVDKYPGIVEVVDNILSRDREAASVAVHWQCFGSNGQEKADYSRGVLERFTRRAPSDWWVHGKIGNVSVQANAHVKNIVNPRMVDSIKDCHNPGYFLYFHAVNENSQLSRGGMPLPILAEKLVINHYQLKSKEEYLNRCIRGNAINFRSAGIYNEERFLASDHNEIFDDGILKYRAERAKIYRYPDKSNADERLLNALERNLSPALKADTPPSFYEGKMETFLTCLAVSSYLKKKLTYSKAAKFFEEMSLKAILKSFDKMSLPEAQFVIRELPSILRFSYPVVKDIRDDLLQRIPKIVDEIRIRGHFREFANLYYLQELLNLALCKDNYPAAE